MGVKGFLCGLVWGEFRKRLLPKPLDVATALVLTILFGLACGWPVVAYLLSFMLFLFIVYLTVRLVQVVKALLYLRRMKNKVSGVFGAVGSVKGLLKK